MGLKKLLIDSGENFRPRDLDYGDNAPLITKRLPGVEENPESNTREVVDDLTSGLIPGGALTAGERAITDTKRISKFLLTREGITFLANEAIGQRMNPQSLISPTNRTRTPLNLLAQIPATITGTHIRRDGILDTVFEGNFNYDFDRNGGLKYEKELRDILNSGLEGREGYSDSSETPSSIGGLLGTLENISNKKGSVIPNPQTLLTLYNNFQIDPGLSTIREYPGGAGSTFGIGNTRIKKYEDVGRPDEDFIQQEINKGKEKIRTKYLTGDPSLNPSPDGTYTYNSPTVDQINVSDVFQRVNLTEKFEDAENLKDFIKFKIALVDTSNPLNDEVLSFRAFLENMNDNYTGNWNSYTYNGRAEQFHTYSGFDRNMSFNFKVAPQSMIELKPLYRKLNYLVSSTAPEYVNRRMRGRYVRLTIGDWCYEVPGFFPSIGLSWSSNYPWEMNPDNEDMLSQHPLILDVSCTFKPIHDFTPESKIDKPFITRTGNMIKPYSEFPNAPSPTVPIPPRTISNNIPTPELQIESQTNLNNTVDNIKRSPDIEFKRIEAGGATIDMGYVKEIPNFGGDPNSINRLLSNLSNQRLDQSPSQIPAQTAPSLTTAQRLEQNIANQIAASERKKFGMF